MGKTNFKMKTTKPIKIASIILLIPIIFIGGVVVGNIYNVTDFLCPSKAEPYILEKDFISINGIVMPKGTIIALRQCAYMQRFNYQFAVDNAIKLKPHTGNTGSNYGFAELFPKENN